MTQTASKRPNRQSVAQSARHQNFEMFAAAWNQHDDKAKAWGHIQNILTKALGWGVDGEDLILYGRRFVNYLSRGYHEQYVGTMFIAMPGTVFFDILGARAGMVLENVHTDETSSLQIVQFKPDPNTIHDIEILGQSGVGRNGQHYDFQRHDGCLAYIKLPGDRDLPHEFLGIDRTRWRTMHPTLKRWFPGLRIV